MRCQGRDWARYKSGFVVAEHGRGAYHVRKDALVGGGSDDLVGEADLAIECVPTYRRRFDDGGGVVLSSTEAFALGWFARGLVPSC